MRGMRAEKRTVGRLFIAESAAVEGEAELFIVKEGDTVQYIISEMRSRRSYPKTQLKLTMDVGSAKVAYYDGARAAKDTLVQELLPAEGAQLHMTLGLTATQAGAPTQRSSTWAGAGKQAGGPATQAGPADPRGERSKVGSQQRGGGWDYPRQGSGWDGQAGGGWGHQVDRSGGWQEPSRGKGAKGTGFGGGAPADWAHVGGGRERSVASAVASQLGAMLGGGGREEAEFSTPTQGKGQAQQWPPPDMMLPAAQGFSPGPAGGTKRVAGGSPTSAYQEQLLAKSHKGHRQERGQPAPKGRAPGGAWRGGGSRLKSFSKKKAGPKAPHISVKETVVKDKRSKPRQPKSVSKEGSSQAHSGSGIPSFTASEEAPLYGKAEEAKASPAPEAPENAAPQGAASQEAEATVLDQDL